MFSTKKIQNFKSVLIYMKNAECVETNEQLIFPIFSLWGMIVFVPKIGQFFDEFWVQNQL